MLTKQTFLTQQVQESNVWYYTSRGKPTGKPIMPETHMLKSKDLRVGKRSEISQSLSDGSTNNPTRAQKVTTGMNSHKDQSVGEWEKSQNFRRGILSIN